MVGLYCGTGAFSSCGERRPALAAVGGHLIAVASPVVQTLGTQTSVVVARGLQSAGSIVVAHGFSSSAACGIFPDQASNQCLLHCKVDS